MPHLFRISDALWMECIFCDDLREKSQLKKKEAVVLYVCLDMQCRVYHARELFPMDCVHSSIFLAGPTPRRADVQSWRAEALCLLTGPLLRYGGDVFIPEDRGVGGMHGVYEEQLAWETEGLRRADVIVFWVPRDMATLPGLTTNDEWGFWKASGKVVFGAPKEAVSVRYQRSYCEQHGIPCFSTLEDTLRAATTMIGEVGARRSGGECYVPLHVWRTLSFQSWYGNLCAAGNKLCDCDVKFALSVKGSGVFLWLLWVDVWIAAEDRHKKNELVLGRPDVACTVMLWRSPDSVWESKVVLVREYRSAVSNGEGGYVVELPGGSDWKTPATREVAREEVQEELGVQVPLEALVPLGMRQIAPTVLSHKSACFVHEIDEGMLRHFEGLQTQGAQFGLAEDTERTYVEVRTVKQLFESDSVDWATLGQVAKAVFSSLK